MGGRRAVLAQGIALWEGGSWNAWTHERAFSSLHHFNVILGTVLLHKHSHLQLILSPQLFWKEKTAICLFRASDARSRFKGGKACDVSSTCFHDLGLSLWMTPTYFSEDVHSYLGINEINRRSEKIDDNPWRCKNTTRINENANGSREKVRKVCESTKVYTNLFPGPWEPIEVSGSLSGVGERMFFGSCEQHEWIYADFVANKR